MKPSAVSSRLPATPEEARSLQREWRELVETEDRIGPIENVAGIDAHHRHGMTQGAAVLLSYPALAVEARRVARRPEEFPYVTGLLSFREAPALLDAIALLPRQPDVLIVDGQGIAHPRGFGLACHLGVVTGLPAIGVGKSRLVGKYDEPGPERGSWSPLFYSKRIVGAALRTRAGCNPVFVSVGHRLALDTAIAIVLACAPRYRLSEPIRQADKLSREDTPEIFP